MHASPPSRREEASRPENVAPKGPAGGDVLLPLAVALCVVLGWYVILDYERTALELAPHAPALLERVWSLRLMMAFLSVGGLGLGWLAVRDATGRRNAEAALKRLNAALASRVERRTEALRTRTAALRESQLRETLREKEAEVAFQAGLVEAAGHYLHDVGNALSALDLELLRLGKATEGADRLQAAFANLAGDIDAGRRDEAGRLLGSLREAVLGRAFPRVLAAQTALSEIKGRMADDLERRRDAFALDGGPRHYVQTFRLDLELAAMLDRLPRSAGSDPVVRDIEVPVTVRTRKHAFLTGLAGLLRQTLDHVSGPVAVRLRQDVDLGGTIVVEGAAAEGVSGPAVSACINFLNENNGSLRFEAAGNGQPSRLVVVIGEALPATPLP